MDTSFALYQSEMRTPTPEDRRHERPTEPAQLVGYWRIMAAKTKTDWPVLISVDSEADAIAVKIGETAFYPEREPAKWQGFIDKSWLHCIAVNKNDWLVATTNGFWPDGRPARQMTEAEKLGIDVGTGDNQAPAHEVLGEQIAALAEKLDNTPAPTSQDDADNLQTLLDRMSVLLKTAEAKRVAEKEPHLQASREVDARWKGLMEPGATAASDADKRKRAYLKAELERRQREAREQAEAEARRRAEEQEARNAELAKQAEDMGIEPGDLAEPVAPEPAKPAPVEIPKASSATGIAKGLRKVKKVTITDMGKLLAHFFPTGADYDAEAYAYFQKRAESAARGKVTLPGVTITEEYE